MAGGLVNRTTLQSNYQNAGDVYDDKKTEGAIEVLANQMDLNWNDYEAAKAGFRDAVDGGFFTDTDATDIVDGGTFA